LAVLIPAPYQIMLQLLFNLYRIKTNSYEKEYLYYKKFVPLAHTL